MVAHILILFFIQLLDDWSTLLKNLKMSGIKKTKEVTNSFAKRWAETVIKFRWPVLGLSLLLALGLGSNAKMDFDGDYHVFFSESNPEMEAFDALQEKYSKDDNIVLVLTPDNGDVFTRENLAAIEELTAEAWNTPYSSRVDAVTNFQYTRAVDDDLFVDDLSFESMNKTDQEVKEIRANALSEPLLVNRLLNEKGSLTAVNITVKLPAKDSAVEIPEVTTSVRQLIANFQESHPNFQVHTSGLVPLNTAFFESSMNDLMLSMGMLLIVIIITLLLTRNVASTFATLVVVLFSIMSAAGFVGLMGIRLTPPSSVFPTMILTLAVADSIHILITMLQKMRQDGLDKTAALIESIRLNFVPVLITSLTTVIGFLTMNFGDVPPFWHLGNITAFGMTMAFIYSTTTLPALMSVLPVKVKQRTKVEAGKTSWYTSFGKLITQHPIRWSLASIAVIGVLTFFATKNVFNDEFVNYFDESVPFRTDTDYISKNLTGIYNVEFSIGSGESGGINNPEYLQNLNQFEDWLKEQPEVVHVNAYSEVARRVNRSMHGDDPAFYKVPDNREEAAQYLLLYELSLPFGLDLNNQVNVDKSETRLTATIENVSSVEMIAFTKRAEGWLGNNTPEVMHALGVSPTLMFSTLGFRQADSMFIGNIIALLLISLILMFALRSFKLGLLSIIPNVAPVLVGFGIWALYKGQINTGMVIVFGMTLGIIVDDTVHFMSKFLRAQREYNYDARQAVIYAFETVGKALVTTTLVLLAGFLVLSTSSFALNSYMARITAIIIPAALIIDFILLPSLLILVSKKSTNQLSDNPLEIQPVPIHNN
ncbi:MAG: putative RND superfamily exporter protein [Gammaproteobacteria bacterium]|jgi:predicted RND superfamily exporter protein